MVKEAQDLDGGDYEVVHVVANVIVAVVAGEGSGVDAHCTGEMMVAECFQGKRAG